jgi:YggT family protein
MISYIVFILFKIIYLILILVILLSWIPIFDIHKEPIASMVRFYEIIMAPFRSVIPPIGMIDISPIIAFIVLQLIEQLLIRSLMALGL